MKTIPVSFLVAGILLPSVCLAQPQDIGRDPRPGDDDRPRGPMGGFEETWKAADADQDGFISEGEFGSMPRLQKLPEEKRGKLFLRLDKDGDGQLSREELGGLRKHRNGHHGKRLWELDSDKSGGISVEEFEQGEFFKKLSPEKREALFKRLDTNRDGVITPQDRPDGRGGRNRPRSFIRLLDTDGDGAMSFEEFRLGPRERELSEDAQRDRFEALDRNDDQKVSVEDFTPPPAPEKD